MKPELRSVLLRVVVACLFASLLCASASAQVPGRNVNMVSGTQWPGGDPFLQRQNEPSIAVSTRNPIHVLAGSNDYRTVDLPGLPSGKLTGDAWLGVFKSTDGGLTWFSTLIPGYPQDNSAQGLASPLKGFDAGADPVVRAGTNGLFYFAGIAFKRSPGSPSVVFVSRFIDNNNLENGDPIAYLDTKTVGLGTSPTFVDKPWIAVDIPRAGARTCQIQTTNPDGTPVTQSFPAGNVYVAYSAIQLDHGVERSQIFFRASTDCGQTWAPPIPLSRSTDVINQGPTIAVNPVDGTVYVAWRRFAYGTQQNAIMVAKSKDAAAHFTSTSSGLFLAPSIVTQFSPFDQGTTAYSMRTNAYPALAIDSSGRAYLAWSQRGVGPGGDARIMLTDMMKTGKWRTPSAVENPPLRGHQFMPALSFATGKLMLIYYDLREDSTIGVFTPVGGGQFTEQRMPVGDLAGPTPQPGNVFNSYVQDQAPPGATSPIQRRHTLDVRAVRGMPGDTPTFTPSIRVTDYLTGSLPGQALIEQLAFDAPNLPLFVQGHAPFMGDYIDLAPAPVFLPNPNGTWRYNSAPSDTSVFHAAWTDNRDVRPPLDGDWTHYTPPNFSGRSSTSLFDGTSSVPNCISGQEGMRNQNIYSARLTQGLFAAVLGNSKPLGQTTLPDGRVIQIQRGFAVTVQNAQDTLASYRLTIANQPPGGKASFLQFPQAGLPDPLTVLDVDVAPHSSIARTVFADSSDPNASIRVDVQQITAAGGTIVPPSSGGLQTSLMINADITNPSIANPSISNPSISNPSIANAEVYNPSISNPSIANPSIANPSISNPSISNPSIANPSISNISAANPSIANPSIANPSIANPSIANPDLANPSISNPSIANSTLTDATWTFTNEGNTAATYSVKLLLAQLPPQNVVSQLLIHQTYTTPAAQSCSLGTETHTVLLANVANPTFETGKPQFVTQPGKAPMLKVTGALQPNPTDPSVSNTTIALGPGESAQITLRVVDPNPPSPNSFNPATAVQPAAISQAVNTVDVANGSTTPPAAVPPPSTPVSISTFGIPDGRVGAPFNFTLQANGGTGAITWTFLGQSLPQGLQLDTNTGVLSGIPGAAGVYTIGFQVQDSSNPPSLAARYLTLNIAAPLSIVPPIATDGVFGQAYNLAIAAVGGIGVKTWSIIAGTPPPGLSFGATGANTAGLAGTPTSLGLFTFTVQAQDSGSAATAATAANQIVSVQIYPLLVITTTSLPNGKVSQAYSANLSATGGSGTVTWSVASGSLPTGLTLSAAGVLSGTTTTAGTFNFVLQVQDTANPAQVRTQAYSVDVLASSGTLTFVQQPSNGTANVSITPTVTVQARDAANAALPGVNVTLVLGNNPGNASLASATATTDPAGLASFPNLQVSSPGLGYTLVANGTGLLSATSSPFDVTVTPATAFVVQPSNSTAGQPMTPDIQVSVHDNIGGPVAGAAVTLSFGFVACSSAGSGGGPVAVTNANGIAQFNNLVFDRGGIGYTIVASSPGASPSTSIPFNVAGPCDTPNMNAPRESHTATLLNNGKVLIAGGDDGVVSQSSAELYDPAPGVAQTISVVPASTLTGPAICKPGFAPPQCSAQPFDSTNDLAYQGNGFAQPAVAKDNILCCATIHQPQFANDGFYGNGASWISNSANSWVKVDLGRTVLIDHITIGRDRLGGFDDRDPGQFTISVATSDNVYANGDDSNDGAEYTQVFDSAPLGFSGFISGPQTIQASFSPVMARFIKLTVTNAGADIDEIEVFGPANNQTAGQGTFTPTGSMTVERDGHRATRLANGQVLVTGGYDINGVVLSSAELYDPVAGTFGPTGAMSVERYLHISTVLLNGKVLVAGGSDNNGSSLSSAELYDPVSGTFSPTGSMGTARFLFTAVRLQNGKVLVMGGSSSGGVTTILASAELYDPVAGTFAPTGNMNAPRRNFRATLLSSGQVLVTGGRSADGGSLSSSELYDPNTGVFTLAGPMGVPRRGHEQTLLANGEMLETGGYGPSTVTAKTDTFNPATNAFRPGGNMTVARGDHTATLLNTGKVLVTGGFDNLGNVLASAELVSGALRIETLSLPDGSTVQPYNALLRAEGGTGALTWTFVSGTMPPGLNLSAGGVISGTPTAVGSFTFTVNAVDSGTPAQSDSKIFTIQIWTVVNSAALTFVVQPTNAESGLPISPTVAVLAQNSGGPVQGVAVTLSLGTNTGGATLSNNTAITGPSGFAVFPNLSLDAVSSGYTLVASAVNFVSAVSNPFDVVPPIPVLSFVALPNPVTAAPIDLPPIQVRAVNRNGVPLQGIDVALAVVNHPCASGSLPSSGALTDSSGIATLSFPGFRIRGGGAGLHWAAAADRATTVLSNPFDVIGFCGTASMNSARAYATGTNLLNGKVLIAGGFDLSNQPQATADLYDEATGTFTAVPNMNVARSRQKDTVLPSGMVLITGGLDATNNSISSAELYDPVSNSFSLTGSMANGRQSHIATLLPNGKVLIMGGGSQTAELYDPAAGTFSATGTPVESRINHRAILLPNGKVLIVGGSTLPSAELYDPAAGTFAATGNMSTVRHDPALALLPNGKVLVVGGWNGSSPIATAEIYDPATGTFGAPIPTGFAHNYATATLLANGNVLIAGNGAFSEVFDSTAGTFSRTGNMLNGNRYAATANPLPSGNVLVAGGLGGVPATNLAEVFYPFATAPLTITTQTLPDATVGQPYNATLNSIGGTPPVSWTVVSGALPAGLNLSSGGVISGTPTQAGPNGFVVQATDSANPSASTTQQLFLTVNNVAGASLSFQAQPSSTVAGQVMAPAVQVLVQNSGGPVVGQQVNLTFGNNPSGATLFGPSAVSGAGGIAVFSGISVNNPGVGYTLVASAPNYAGATSTAFDVAPVGAALQFVVQPTVQMATLPIVPAVQVRATDGFGNGLVGVPITLQIGNNPGGGTLSGATAVTNLAGIATFPSLSINNAGNGYTLVASLPNFASATSNSFNIVPLAIDVKDLTQNQRIIAGQPVSPPPQFLVRTTQGTPLPNVNLTATLVASPCHGATLQGTTTVTSDANGIATFTNGIFSNGGWGYSVQLSAAGVASPVDGFDQFPVEGLCNTGNMTLARRGQTATLLPNGKLLITGGLTPTGFVASAELYDPVTGTFAATGNMTTARFRHTATLLPNGKVLIAGGLNASGVPIASAELYDPASGIFSATGSMGASRNSQTATLLPNGKVLIAGGQGGAGSVLASAELYDPNAGTFTATGTMGTPRVAHSAVVLANGNVLVAGGVTTGNVIRTSSAEIYSVTGGSFSGTGSLQVARSDYSATPLPNGTVLIAGGSDGSNMLSSAEIFNPTLGTFSLTSGSMSSARRSHSAVPLPNGKVLMAGGAGSSGASISSVEVYDPAADTFTAEGGMSYARAQFTAVLLANSSVLLAGGADASLAPLSSAELFFPVGPPSDDPKFEPVSGSMNSARWAHAQVQLPNGEVLLAGGVDASDTVVASAELFDPATGAFTPTGSMGTARYYPEAQLLPNGKVLVAGGADNNSVAQSSGEVFDPSNGTFASTTNNMSSPRWGHTSVRLGNGSVLVLGGINFGVSTAGLATADLYDFGTNTFTATGNLNTGRMAPTATLLPNGKVLIAGGRTTSGVPASTLSTAELYDPATGTFSFTGNMTIARFNARAVLLPNGKVLITGGRGTTNALLNAADLYDPATGTFSATGSMSIARANTASFVLLPNGKALITGGFVPPGPVATGDYYDPEIGLFFRTGFFMTTDRVEHRANLLPNGKVLVAGGFNGANASLATAETYSPGGGSLMPTYACGLEPTIRSTSGTTPTAIKFINASTITQNVYWLDYSGVRQLYATLLPGQSYVQGTFFTHPWVITDAGNSCRGIYFPSPDTSTAVLK